MRSRFTPAVGDTVVIHRGRRNVEGFVENAAPDGSTVGLLAFEPLLGRHSTLACRIKGDRYKLWDPDASDWGTGERGTVTITASHEKHR